MNAQLRAAQAHYDHQSPADDELPESFIRQATELLAAKHADEIEDLAAVLYLAAQREPSDARWPA